MLLYISPIKSVPTMAVVESFQPGKADCSTVRGKGEMVMVRGNLLPLIRFDELFGVKTDSREPWKGLVAQSIRHT